MSREMDQQVDTLLLTGSTAWRSSLYNRAGRCPRPVAIGSWAGRCPMPAIVIGTTGSHVPRQSLNQTRATSMPGTTWAVGRSLPDSSRGRDSPRFWCHLVCVDTSSVVHSRSPSWLIPVALHVRLSRNARHTRLLTGAACGGLTPPPAGRRRRTYLHLQRSQLQVESSTSIPPSAFVAHNLHQSVPGRRKGRTVVGLYGPTGQEAATSKL
jgi:hypothetical protein